MQLDILTRKSTDAWFICGAPSTPRVKSSMPCSNPGATSTAALKLMRKLKRRKLTGLADQAVEALALAERLNDFLRRGAFKNPAARGPPFRRDAVYEAGPGNIIDIGRPPHVRTYFSERRAINTRLLSAGPTRLPLFGRTKKRWELLCSAHRMPRAAARDPIKKDCRRPHARRARALFSC